MSAASFTSTSFFFFLIFGFLCWSSGFVGSLLTNEVVGELALFTKEEDPGGRTASLITEVGADVVIGSLVLDSIASLASFDFFGGPRGLFGFFVGWVSVEEQAIDSTVGD